MVSDVHIRRINPPLRYSTENLQKPTHRFDVTEICHSDTWRPCEAKNLI